MEAVDACYHFAGIVGLDGLKQTLNQYFRLASGRIRQRRFEMVELATLVWSFSDIDIEHYVNYGAMESLNIKGPVVLPESLEEKVQSEVARLRAENPNHPRVRT